MKGPSPLAATVAHSLREELSNGALPPGTAMPAERILADRYGVSRTVVREALATLARDGLLLLRDRCRPVVAGSGPRAPRHKGGRHIAIWLWPYTEDFIASSILRGVQRVIGPTPDRLIMGTAAHGSWDEVLESESRFLHELADDEHVDGAILWYLGGDQNRAALQEAQKRGVEIVFVDRRPPEGIEADFVGTENLTAAQNAVNHLIELGHRRIALVSNIDPVSAVHERERGYRRALEDAGLWPSSDIRFVHGVRDEAQESASLREIAEAILSHEKRPTAVFAINDVAAFGLHEAFRDFGVRVPEDISIVGFDGLLRWVPGGGHITTVLQNFTRIGELAAETILDRFRNPSSHSYRHILLDAPLGLAGSTAPPSDIDPGNQSGNARELTQ